MLKEIYPQIQYDPISHILKIENKEKKEGVGLIAVCTAGTADIPVAEEAAQTAEYFGAKVERIYDVGVAGIHRLFARLDAIQDANLRGCSGRDGRRTGKRAGWSGEQTGDRRTYFRGIWCQYEWNIRAAHDDQFLRQRDCYGKYRQWIWCRLYCNTD